VPRHTYKIWERGHLSVMDNLARPPRCLALSTCPSVERTPV
jgi:hypothetical protein